MSSEKNIRDLSRFFSAHLYRAGIFGYIWLAPVGCHLNMGILNLAYKYLLQADEVLAAKTADLLGGLLWALPSENQFTAFESSLHQPSEE